MKINTQWQGHVEAWRESGLSQADYCQQHGLSGVNYPGRINDNYPGRFWLKKWVTFLGFVFFDNFLLLFQLWWRDE